MACPGRQFARVLTVGALALLLLPAYAQNVPRRLRGLPGPGQPPPPAPAAQATTTSTHLAPAAQSQPASPMAQSALAQSAPSLLQQPAQEAQVILDGDRLSIRADNSSLSAILHQVAGKSGMQIEGLSGDERVFGTFGPGAPRDVLADLLNGTAYNVVLLGDLSDGAPRELILTPATHGGVTPAPAPVATAEDAAANEPEPEPPPPPPAEVPPQGSPVPPTPGVKTPQQLFEQLQRMRQAQQQGTTTTQDPQQQQQQAPQ
jgi:hypothetical protein